MVALRVVAVTPRRVILVLWATNLWVSMVNLSD